MNEVAGSFADYSTQIIKLQEDTQRCAQEQDQSESRRIDTEVAAAEKLADLSAEVRRQGRSVSR